ncbi:MAG TPA: hypothetical protein VIK28_06240 [Sedimentisphaerales bacterium]|jgi:hypothetical protein
MHRSKRSQASGDTLNGRYWGNSGHPVDFGPVQNAMSSKMLE